MRFFCLVALALCTYIHGAFSQNPSQTQIIPPTPNVASIAQYGNVPVGLYTGQPNVSFPLYVIDNGHLKVPINLSYNYNGLKLEEYPSWVGTGWTLNATSVITRQTRGLPDESNGGFNGPNKRGIDVQAYINLGVTPETPNVNFQTSYPTHYSVLNGIASNLIDSEPDMFVFSCPGYSGKFYFDESQCNDTVKVANVIPAQNITIKGHFDYAYVFGGIHGQIKKFEIIDERGNVYTFDVKERSAASRMEDVDSGNPDLDFQNSWYLSSIADPFSQTISYTYRTRKIDLPPTISQRRVLPFEVSAIPVLYAKHSSWEVILDNIVSRNHTNDVLARVDFIEEANERLDWQSESWEGYEPTDQEQPKALQKIKVTVHGKVIKEVNFTYGYFGNNARLRLDKFQETSNGEEIPAYEFTYVDSQLFPKIGNRSSLLSQDHWGYYRGTNESTLLMPLKIVNEQGAVIGDIPGNDRAPIPESAAIGILTSIKYPTGGTTEFEYEPNDYNPDLVSFTVPAAACGNDLVLKKRAFAQWTAPLGPNAPTQPPGDEINYEVPFEITGPAGHIVCVRVEYTLDRGDCADDRAIVAIYDPTITQIWTHVLFKTAFQSTEEHATAVEYLDLLPGQYKLQALVESPNGCDAYNKIKNKATIRVYAPDESNPNRIASGMRIKTIKDCSIPDGSDCYTKFFDYEDLDIPAHSSGILVSGPTYNYWTTAIRAYSSYANGYVSSSQSQVPIVSTMGNTVGYKYVTITEAQNGSKGKSVHKFTSPSDHPNTGSGVYPFSDPQEYPYPPIIDNDWSRGIDILTQQFKAGSAAPISKSEVVPEFPIVTTTKGLKMGPKYTLVDEGTIADAHLILSGLKAYYFVPYDIKVGWQKIVSQSTAVLDENQGTFITSSTDLFYGNPAHRQVTRKETFNSARKTLATTYKYKADLSSIQNLTASEISGIQSSPLTSTVIEEKNFEGTTLLSTKRNLLTGPNLSKIQQSTKTAPLTDEVTFNAYDERGNVKSYTLRSGEVHSFVYGYDKTLPIAEVVNAAPEDIFFEGFEDNGTPDGIARTGERVLNASTYSFPQSFSPTNPSAIRMTYWYWANDKWNFSNELPFATVITASGNKIDDVRAYPVGSLMSSYTYVPGIGMTSVTDPNGNTSSFTYDSFGKLKTIKDKDGNIVKHYKYHYALDPAGQ